MRSARASSSTSSGSSGTCTASRSSRRTRSRAASSTAASSRWDSVDADRPACLSRRGPTREALVNATAPNTGPLGQERGVGFAIVMTIVTLGIYGLYWIFKSFDEVKRHRGEGLNGILGLLLCIV